jgi:BirA family biotin operon repressor/biotin-[acetyl-CoA-carboxylase] ligase
LSYPATFDAIGQPFILLPTVDSTNNYAMAQAHAGLASHGTAFFALNQTAGKGQRGRNWRSVPGKNIIMSLIIAPSSVRLENSFMMSATIALACYDFYKSFAGDETSIKWPNDIYWRDRKAGGILIENQVRQPDNQWMCSITGMGLNVNQTDFEDFTDRAVSLKQITGIEREVTGLGKQLCKHIENRLGNFYDQNFGQILADYNQVLFKKNQLVKLRQGNIVFETTVREVDHFGNLVVEDVLERRFGFGEVAWIFEEIKQTPAQN